jgi:hypothetical protein
MSFKKIIIGTLIIIIALILLIIFRIESIIPSIVLIIIGTSFIIFSKDEETIEQRKDIKIIKTTKIR